MRACRIFISKNKISKLLIKHQQEEKGKKVFALAFETASGDGGRGGGGEKIDPLHSRKFVMKYKAT